MTTRDAFRWRMAFCAAAATAYAILVYYSTHHAIPGLGAAVAIAPLLLIGVGLAARMQPRWLAVAGGALVVLGLALAWRAIAQHHALVLMLQQAGSYLLLAAFFGRSLLPGKVPVCTRFADLTHGPLDAATRRYSRQVTVAWTLLLLAIVVASVALYFVGGVAAWSVFANFGPLALLPAMFAIEYAVRWHRLPQLRGVRITAGVRAFMLRSGEASSRR